MRRRNTESTNKTRKPARKCICYGWSRCPHCGDSLVLRRGPRVNRRGFRVGKIASRYRQNRQVPMLRVTGKWLARAGFDIGQPFEIDVQHGKLTIMIDTDPIDPAELAAA